MILVLIAAVGGYLYWSSGTREHAGEPPAGGGRRSAGNTVQPVSVGNVAVRDIHLWVSAIGTAIPRNLVTIRARVDGELLRVNFTEGELVRQGKLLAEIDPRPYQAQLDQANGQLARDQALLQNAKLDLERYRDLWSKDSIAKQQVDTQAALVRQYEGTVENDRGIVANAKLQLNYTRILAPITGRIGLRQVDPGNQVHASDANGLATIAQIQPMTVVFSLPEGQLPDINHRLATGEELVAEAWDREQKNLLAKGRLLTTDNQIDPTTGTIKLKAEFANADRSLFPNQFLNIRLLLGVRSDATVIPVSAVMRGSRGTFVYVVDGDGSVRSVPVTPGAVDGEATEIKGELKTGERVVTDGGDKLRDGIKVEVLAPGKPQAAAEGGNSGRHRGKRGDRAAPEQAGRGGDAGGAADSSTSRRQ